MHTIVCNQHSHPEVMQYIEVPQPTATKQEILIQAELIGVKFVDIMRQARATDTRS